MLKTNTRVIHVGFLSRFLQYSLPFYVSDVFNTFYMRLESAFYWLLSVTEKETYQTVRMRTEGRPGLDMWYFCNSIHFARFGHVFLASFPNLNLLFITSIGFSYISHESFLAATQCKEILKLQRVEHFFHWCCNFLKSLWVNSARPWPR